MELLGTILGVALLVLAVFIVIAVLMQQGKSKGMGAIGGSSSDSFYGKTKGKTWDRSLSKLTTIASIVFVVIVLLVYIIQKDVNPDDYFDANIDGAETTAAETTGSETTAPEATEAETTTPEATEAETTAPEATEAATTPEATEAATTVA